MTSGNLRNDMSDGTELFPLSALLYNKAHDDPENPYWVNFGLDKVEVDSEAYPILSALWNRIVLRFNELYYDRFLAGETMEQWQRRLQVETDRWVRKYERAFRLYASNADGMDEELIANTLTEYLSLTDTGSSSGRTRSTATPDQELNESDNYASAITDSSNENGNVRTGSVRTSITGNGGMTAQINENIDAWMDLETRFVDEYTRVFLATIWY